MRIISKKRLQDFWETAPPAKSPLEQWYKLTGAARWKHLIHLKTTFNHADVATTDNGHRVIIFDVGGNKYRIIAAVHFDRQICYVLRVLTHNDYDMNRWKTEL